MKPPVISSKNLVLKPYSFEDEDKFVETSLDEQSIKYMGNSTDCEEKERKLFHKILQIYQTNNKRWFWVWGIFKDDLFCGHLELKESIHTLDDELEIVYMIHPQYRRTGIMTDVFNILKSYQIQWNKKIIATVRPSNKVSMQLLHEKWGIQQIETVKDQDFNKIILTGHNS